MTGGGGTSHNNRGSKDQGLHVDITKVHYEAVDSVHLGAEKFSWERFRGDVVGDIEIVKNAK